jgi:endoglycosylceramidase
MLGLTSNPRIELIFRRHAETAQRLDMPMLVGEWGAYYENPTAGPAARFVVRQFEALGCGDIYWAYRRTFSQSPLLPALERHPAEAKP